MNLLSDCLSAVWDLRWVLLVCLALVAFAAWWDHVDGQRRIAAVAAGAPVTAVDPNALPERPGTYQPRFFAQALHGIRVGPNPEHIVQLELDPDTARDLAKAWEAWHRSDVTRDVFRPTWAAECDSLIFQAIQADHAETTGPLSIDVGSDPPAHFPVFNARPDFTHRTFPTTNQENQS